MSMQMDKALDSDSLDDEHIPPPRKVLVCRSRLLPYSETFIRDQVRAYSAWQPVFVGTERLKDGLRLEPHGVHVLQATSAGIFQRTFERLARGLGLAAGAAVSQLRGEDASIVHIHFATDAVQFWPLLRVLRKPVVVTLHGYDINTYREWWQRKSASRFDRRFPRRLLAMARSERVHFVAVSESIKARAIDFGLPAARVHVRHIGIDLSRFQHRGVPVSHRAKRIIFIGRFVEKKGPEYLIRAFARVVGNVPDAELIMIGDGPLLEKCKALAASLRVPVFFTGRLDTQQVVDQLHKARVFCLPSIVASNGDAEGLPISILEAQACGLPVVSSARGADEGIVDGATGYVVPEHDVDRLGERLTLLLKDDQLVDRMSEAARQHMARHFDIRYCTRSLEALYERLLPH